MPPLRDWPVCWLFLLATATADAAMLGGSTDLPWPLGMVVGQMMLLGMWVVHSRSHRLIRGALFVVGLGGLSWLAVTVVEPFYWQRWSFLLGATVAIQSTVAAAAAATRWAGRLLPEQTVTATNAERLQYPLIEIFGWTIVVAGASVLLRAATNVDRLFNSEAALFWTTGCLVVGVVGSLLLDAYRWPRHIVVTATVGLPGLYWLVWRNTLGEATVMFAAHLYLATFVYCRWLDADPQRP